MGGKKHVDEPGSKPNPYAEEIELRDLVLGRMVGSGTTAQVYLGLWRGRTVAIKQLSVLCMDEALEKALDREISILASVNHLNLVRLFGYCLSSNPCHLVCEYCDGGNLFDLLHNRMDLGISLVQQVKMCTDIARGMDYLHKFSPQIVHRDLKSLNLLLAKELTGLKDIPFVKVADFGLARVLEPQDKVALTTFVGTIHWMAPEMFDNKGYNEKVDVYSYGIVMYEMFAREPPFEDKASEEIERVVRRGGRPDLEAIPPKLPENLKSIMFRSWAQDPKDRPSFDMIVEALNSFSCVGCVAPKRLTPGSLLSSSGYRSKLRAVGPIETRAVSL